MSLTEEIKKDLNNESHYDEKARKSVDRAICNGAYDSMFNDDMSPEDKTIEGVYKKLCDAMNITSSKTLAIKNQLEKILDMIDHADPDSISIDIKVKTLTSKQRYRHKGSKVKISFFE